MLYFVYLDEFGHIGPYLGHDHPQYNTHPAFGLGGIVLPYPKIRAFSSFFFQLKNHLLQWELNRSDSHPAKWEKKGSALYTLKNLHAYPELRRGTNRIFNKLDKLHGRLFYVGLEKHRNLESQDAKGLYTAVLREAIKRLNQECESQRAHFFLMLDQSDDVMRGRLVEAASISMYGGDDAKRRLVEPPLQAESHLYQTLQCADWICGILGRLSKFELAPETFAELEDFEKYFGSRIRQLQIRSSIRHLPAS